MIFCEWITKTGSCRTNRGASRSVLWATYWSFSVLAFTLGNFWRRDPLRKGLIFEIHLWEIVLENLGEEMEGTNGGGETVDEAMASAAPRTMATELLSTSTQKQASRSHMSFQNPHSHLALQSHTAKQLPSVWGLRVPTWTDNLLQETHRAFQWEIEQRTEQPSGLRQEFGTAG